jgi:hypothetical protein
MCVWVRAYKRGKLRGWLDTRDGDAKDSSHGDFFFGKWNEVVWKVRLSGTSDYFF